MHLGLSATVASLVPITVVIKKSVASTCVILPALWQKVPFLLLSSLSRFDDDDNRQQPKPETVKTAAEVAGNSLNLKPSRPPPKSPPRATPAG
jgi:hypothetical protein